MKKISVLVFVALAAVLFFVSCGPKPIYRPTCSDSRRYVVYETPENTRAGVEMVDKVIPKGQGKPPKLVWKTIIPAIYDEIQENMDRTVFVCYASEQINFYDYFGTKLLDEFTITKFQYHAPGKGTYWQMMFAVGGYARVDTKEGIVGLFVDNILGYSTDNGNKGFFSFGPYLNFEPGCAGYMAQDCQSKKWGAVFCQVARAGKDLPATKLFEKQVVPFQYDQIIEVNYTDYASNHKIKGEHRYVWFAHDESASRWDSFNYRGEKIPVDWRLLNSAKAMAISSEVRGNHLVFQRQRLGQKDASVVFLNQSMQRINSYPFKVEW